MRNQNNPQCQPFTVALIVLAMAAGANQARAQWSGWGAQGGVTATESNDHGLSDLIRSTSQARLTNEQSNTIAIQNQLLATQTYFDKRKLNENYRAEKLAQARELNIQMQKNYKARPPVSLSSTQLDPQTGEIYWPVELMATEYADDRKKLETLFAQRAKAEGALTYNAYTDIQSTCNAMYDTLHKQIQSMDSMKYLAARKFIQGLENEAKYTGA